MHLGCFGSIIAFDEKLARCSLCPDLDACKVEVEGYRPNFIRFLDRQSSPSGVPMSQGWLNKQEKRERLERARKERIISLLPAASRQGAAKAFDAGDDTQRDLIERLAIEGVDPLKMDHAQTACISPEMSSILFAIKFRKLSPATIAQVLAKRHGLSAKKAQQAVRQIVPLLCRLGRCKIEGKEIALA